MERTVLLIESGNVLIDALAEFVILLQEVLNFLGERFLLNALSLSFLTSGILCGNVLRFCLRASLSVIVQLLREFRIILHIKSSC